VRIDVLGSDLTALAYSRTARAAPAAKQLAHRQTSVLNDRFDLLPNLGTLALASRGNRLLELRFQIKKLFQRHLVEIYAGHPRHFLSSCGSNHVTSLSLGGAPQPHILGQPFN